MECFIVWGKLLKLSSMEDVYFLIGLHFRGWPYLLISSFQGCTLGILGTKILFGAEYFFIFVHSH